MRKLVHSPWPHGLAAACLSLLLLPLSSFKARSETLTLERALERAAAHSPALSAARKEVDAAQAAATQAGAWRNPELSASVEDLRGERRTSTVTVDIPLELGGKRAARIGAAARAQAVAEAELAQARAELRARVTGAFFGLLLAQERSRLAQGSADIAARAAEAAARRVAAGKVSPVEATRAGVDLANARLESAEAAAELETARWALALQLGAESPTLDAAAADLAVPPARPGFAELVPRLDDAPAAVIGRQQFEHRRALVDVERSKAVPDLTLSLGGQREAGSGRTQAVIGLSLPIPLFDRNQGAVLEASRRAEKARDEQQATRLRLLGELQDASSRLAMATSSLQTLQATVLPAAQQAFDAATRGFEAGKFGFLEVLDAQRALLQARARTLNTLAAAHQAAAAIDRITGR